MLPRPIMEAKARSAASATGERAAAGFVISGTRLAARFATKMWMTVGV